MKQSNRKSKRALSKPDFQRVGAVGKLQPFDRFTFQNKNVFFYLIAEFKRQDALGVAAAKLLWENAVENVLTGEITGFLFPNDLPRPDGLAALGVTVERVYRTASEVPGWVEFAAAAQRIRSTQEGGR